MNKYQEMFSKFGRIASKEFDSFHDAVEEVKSSLEYQSDYSGEEAIIVLGFSGNGKTTWINKFRRDNPGYDVLSIDSVVRNLQAKYGSEFDPCLINKVFGDGIERLCEERTNIVFDGRFLNLFTRCALTQTLHSYGYFVSVVDLTGMIDKTLPQRVIDFCERDMGVKLTPENIGKFVNDPRFKKRYEDIMNFYQRERSCSFIDEQKKEDVLYLDTDFVLDKDSYADISISKKSTDVSDDKKGAKK